jgi:hypothetical protein
MKIWRRVTCWITKATRVQAHASARAIIPPAAPTRTHAHIRAREHTHTHREICNTYCFPRQQWYPEHL